jgi:NADH-quinone oxidoreductase subunit G/NADP-reducing hydrogenase subunit HndD
VKYAEEFVPEFIPNISSCKSPQQMLGAVIKSYYAEKHHINPEDIYTVSIMPCTAKKFEGQREQMTDKGMSDVDAVLTTRELAELIKTYGIDFKNLEPEQTDSPHGIRSSAGKLFGASGGVMEAAIRTAYHTLTGEELKAFKVNAVRSLKGRKESTVNINGLELNVAVVSGLANAKILLDEIGAGKTNVHFVEIMACPGGCIGGGGQKIGADEDALRKRMQSLYTIDEKASLKVSHKNPEVIELYREYFDHPNSHKAHELLHTSYKKRDILL